MNGKEWFIAEYEQLGAIKKEKKGVLICFLLFIGLITQPWHKIEVALNEKNNMYSGYS